MSFSIAERQELSYKHNLMYEAIGKTPDQVVPEPPVSILLMCTDENLRNGVLDAAFDVLSKTWNLPPDQLHAAVEKHRSKYDLPEGITFSNLGLKEQKLYAARFSQALESAKCVDTNFAITLNAFEELIVNF